MTDTNDTPPIDPIHPISLSDEMENSFLEYAMSVIMSRAGTWRTRGSDPTGPM